MIREEVTFVISSDPSDGAINITEDGSSFEIDLGGEGLKIPKDAMNVTVSCEESTIWWVVPNIITGVNDTFYVYGDSSDLIAQLYTVVIPQGLYDLSELNKSLYSILESLGARTSGGLALISLTADPATQRVKIRFNYANVYVDFTQPQTLRTILGYNAQQYGPFAGAPLNASFNQVNYFLIHSDLVNKGIRFNNQYTQTIAQVLIDVSPGSQIVSKPFHPAKSDAQGLAGITKNSLRFSLTDDKQRAVNTNGEYWTTRIVISYHKNQ
jgi:hypothetical protein